MLEILVLQIVIWDSLRHAEEVFILSIRFWWLVAVRMISLVLFVLLLGCLCFKLILSHLPDHCVQTRNVMIKSKFTHRLNNILILNCNTLLVSNFKNNIRSDKTDEFCESHIYQFSRAICYFYLGLDLFHRNWCGVLFLYFRRRLKNY